MANVKQVTLSAVELYDVTGVLLRFVRYLCDKRRTKIHLRKALELATPVINEMTTIEKVYLEEFLANEPEVLPVVTLSDRVLVERFLKEVLLFSKSSANNECLFDRLLTRAEQINAEGISNEEQVYAKSAVDQLTVVYRMYTELQEENMRLINESKGKYE